MTTGGYKSADLCNVPRDFKTWGFFWPREYTSYNLTLILILTLTLTLTIAITLILTCVYTYMRCECLLCLSVLTRNTFPSLDLEHEARAASLLLGCCFWHGVFPPNNLH